MFAERIPSHSASVFPKAFKKYRKYFKCVAIGTRRKKLNILFAVQFFSNSSKSKVQTVKGLGDLFDKMEINSIKIFR